MSPMTKKVKNEEATEEQPHPISPTIVDVDVDDDEPSVEQEEQNVEIPLLERPKDTASEVYLKFTSF